MAHSRSLPGTSSWLHRDRLGLWFLDGFQLRPVEQVEPGRENPEQHDADQDAEQQQDLLPLDAAEKVVPPEGGAEAQHEGQDRSPPNRTGNAPDQGREGQDGKREQAHALPR